MKRLSLLITGILLFGFASLHSQIPDYVPKTGLIGWWPFNGNAQDESGNENHGTVNGAVLTTNRYNQNNTAYFFDGKDDFISTIYSGVLENQSRTFSFWINTNSSEGQQVIGYGNQPPSGGEFNVLLNQVCQGISVDIHDNYITYNHPSQFGINTWNHVVVTYNNTISDNIEGVRFYINGDLVSTSIACSNPVNKIINTLNSPIFLGKYQSGDFAYVSGKLDDIGIWNRALDSNEIKRLFNNESSQCSYAIKESDTTICPGTSLKLNAIQTSAKKSLIPLDGLIGYWPFNGNANDESGNGNHGIVDKATLTSDKNSKQNSAYQFYKSGSKILIPDSKVLNNKFVSMSFWLKSVDTASQSYIQKLQEGTANHEQYGIVSNFERKNSIEFSVKNGSNCTPGYGWEKNIKDVVVYDGIWHNITATYDGVFSNIYVDTVLVSEIQKSFLPIDSCPGGDILFGKGWDNKSNLEGILDDIAIWNKALTKSEVKQVYQSEHTICTDSLQDDSFTWSDGQKGRIITVNPDTSTTYVLTVTDGLIIHQDSIRVTVGGDSCYSCTYAILEQDTTICQGTTLQLHSDLSDTINANIPKEGLIGYWPFNGNANDESGNGNHGIVNGADLTKGRNGKDNQAYAFDGVDDFIQTNNDSISSDGYAISAWFKTTNNAEGQGLVISRSQSQVDGLYLNKDRIVQCMSKCNKSFHLNEKTIQYNDDKWHHFVSVYDGKQMRGYIDGQLYSMQDQVGTICLNAPFEFGNDRPYARFYKGILDDIAIWNRPLSDSEVVSLFKLESVKVNTTIPQDGLVGYWPFNGNANDESGNGNHGIVNGAVLSTDRCSKNDFAFKFYRNESSFIQVTRLMTTL
jgi:hypothetical protein